MSINNELIFTWEGENYKVNITMRVIDELERHINLIKLYQDCLLEDIKYSQAAKLISLLLNMAGAKVTQEEVWIGMFNDSTNPKDVAVFTSEVLATCFPVVGKKKPETKKKK